MLVEINLLLSDHIKLSDLFIDDLLTFFKCIRNLFNLSFDVCQLLVRVLNHLIEVLNLVIQVVYNCLLFVLLMDLIFNLISGIQQDSLLVMDGLQLVQQVIDLFNIRLIFSTLAENIRCM